MYKLQNFFCEECAKEHEKIEIKNVLINLYEVGYICEDHCEFYSTSCNICKINLCEICKENHEHIHIHGYYSKCLKNLKINDFTEVFNIKITRYLCTKCRKTFSDKFENQYENNRITQNLGVFHCVFYVKKYILLIFKIVTFL